MVAIVGKEGCHAGGTSLRIVICKLCYRQKVTPVRHLIVDEGAEVDLELLVDPLGLAIGLGVEGRAYTALDADEVEKVLLEGGRESRIAIGDDVYRDPVKALVLFSKDLDKVIGLLTILLKRNEVGYFRKGIDYYLDKIVAVR